MFPYPILFDSTQSDYAGAIIAWFIIFIFIGPIALCMILRSYDRWVDWWEDLFGIAPYDSKSYSTNNTTKTTTTTKTKPAGTWGKKLNEYGLYDDDRQEPPKATFFERVSGQERIEEGPWEELYLTARELSGWQNKKRKLKLVSSENNTKIPELDDTMAFLEQNDDYKGYRG